MSFSKLLSSVAVVLSACWAQAEPGAPVPAEFQQCTVCHGVQLKGNPSTGAPRLSGLQDWYVENQLMSFRNGWRGDHEQDYIAEEMRTVASGLTPKQVKSVTKYVGSTQSELTFSKITGDVHKGEVLFSSCAACHGADGAGNKAMSAPSLLVQSDWYLHKQINDFRNGFRGADKDDANGQLMAASVTTLKTQDDINNLMAYIVQLQQQQEIK